MFAKMVGQGKNKFISAVFLTFSGNCKKALTLYQSCFGGTLHFETFEKEWQGFIERPVINGTLVSDTMVIHGSDLVHNEGRKLGNYMAIFLHCKSLCDREELIEKLELNSKNFFTGKHDNQKLIEIIDAFDVRWVLST